MGLATIDPHSQKEHTKISKIPKFGVNWASFAGADPGEVKRVNFHPPFSEPTSFYFILSLKY